MDTDLWESRELRSVRTLNHYVVSPHWALDDVTRLNYELTAEAVRLSGNHEADAALIMAATAIQTGDIGLADVHLKAAMFFT